MGRHPLRINPEAESDLDEAMRWYDSQRPGLGRDFVSSVEATLNRIERDPEQFPEVYRDVRRARVRRFPYGVFFRIEKTDIVVLSIFHARRDPRRWQART